MGIMIDGGYKESNAEKLKKALAFLGDKHVLAKNSTFEYKRGTSVLNAVIKDKIEGNRK